MKPPSHLTTRLIRIGGGVDAAQLVARLRQCRAWPRRSWSRGRVAYLKVDSQIFDAAKAHSTRRRGLVS